MTQQTTQQAAPETPSNGVANGSGVVHVPTLEERSSAAFEISQPAGEGNAPPDPSAVGSETSDADKARAERRAALAKLQEDERARVDAQAKHREADELRKQLAAEQAKREAVEKTYVDPAKLDPQAFFEMAARLKVTPAELGAWLKSKQDDPAAFAAQAAQRAIDPKLAELEAKNAALEARLNEFLTSQQAQQEKGEAAHYARAFESFTRENAATSPYAYRLLEEIGSEQFAQVATQTAARVPPGAGAQAILDEIEDDMAKLAKIYAPRGAATQQRQAPVTPPNPAAAKAPTTVSNTLAQTRASVVDEDADWASLPFEERSARLFR